MRIAVVGSGISGLSAAWLLSRRHEVVLYEANKALGGHTDTHAVQVEGRTVQVDTGFIVHNPAHYPLLTRLFDELGVATQPTTMSFAVQDPARGVEYTRRARETPCLERANAVAAPAWGVVVGLSRFYRAAPALLLGDGPGPTLGEYLQVNGYGAMFRDQHLVPMASALWSSPSHEILGFPARYLVQFMANHHMLQVAGRPTWRVVRGGSRRYVDALLARWDVQVRANTPVRGVARTLHGVTVRSDAGNDDFDHVVLACHSDDALALLDDASEREREVLGAMTYQSNDTVLHTDARLLPRHPQAWAGGKRLRPG